MIMLNVIWCVIQFSNNSDWNSYRIVADFVYCMACAKKNIESNMNNFALSAVICENDFFFF